MKLQKLNEEKVIELYKLGKNLKQISDFFGISNRTYAIKTILKKNNIVINNIGRNRRCFVDENFFDVIDTKEKSYILGLICSDGSIDNNGYGIGFISKDIELVKLIKRIMSSEHKICDIKSYDKRTKKTYNSNYIHICSKKIVESLSKLGIHNNKSFTCKLPDIPNNLFWHFLRGLFDGDGSITRNVGRKIGSLRFKLIGSGVMIYELKKILSEYGLSDTKISISKYKNEDGYISSLMYYSYKDLKKLYDIMYLDSENLRLERKFDMFSTLREYRNGVYDRRSKMRKVIQKDMNGNLMDVFENIFDAADFLGINPKSLRRVLSGERNHTHGFKFEYL
jgi:hypothetical protein